ncbi:MAG: hypothetical protein MI922_00645, partial [Bacteroidales bacterium]|nr:hypothetical protein [Bacteroidales bacterium]
MKSFLLKIAILNLIFALFIQFVKAEIETYPWPIESELLDSKYFDIKVRQVTPGGTNGDWIELQEFYSFQRN